MINARHDPVRQDSRRNIMVMQRAHYCFLFFGGQCLAVYLLEYPREGIYLHKQGKRNRMICMLPFLASNGPVRFRIYKYVPQSCYPSPVEERYGQRKTTIGTNNHDPRDPVLMTAHYQVQAGTKQYRCCFPPPPELALYCEILVARA